MEIIDENQNYLDKIIKKKIRILAQNDQVKIRHALKNLKNDEHQYIRKTNGDAHIQAYKINPFEEEAKKPFEIKDGDNIKKVLR